MSTIGGNVMTLIDHAKARDPSGAIARVVEMMTQNNEILNDIPFKPTNKTTSHVSTIRTGLPDVYWRKMNQGVPTSKSRKAQVEEGCGMLEAWSEVDVALAKLGGQEKETRLSEAKAFIEAMGQELAATYLYGSESSEEQFVGFAPRFSALTGAANSSNVIDGGGRGATNTSLYVIGWGEDSVHGIFPQGLAAGVQHKDHKEGVSENVNGVSGTKMAVFRDQFMASAGLVVKDWRYVVRIANIDVSALTSETSAADINKLLIKAFHRLPNLSAVKPVIYANRTVIQMMDIQNRDEVKAGGGLTYENVNGKQLINWRGIPFKRTDALLETEEAVA